MFVNSQKKSTDDTTTSFERELADRRRQLQRRVKTVRFDDYLDNAATSYVAPLRRKFKAEDQRSRAKKEVICGYCLLLACYLNTWMGRDG